MPMLRRDAAEAASVNKSRAKWWRTHFHDNRHPDTIPGARILPEGTEPRCWCGGGYPHDWPGKDEGAPHPRN